MLGISPYWISQLVKQLEVWGLIATEYRVFKTKRYKLALFFYQPHITWRLSSFFGSLKKVWIYMSKNFSVVSNINEIDNYYLKQIESLSTTKNSETSELKSDANSQKGELCSLFSDSKAYLKSVQKSQNLEQKIIQEIKICSNEENKQKELQKKYKIVNGRLQFLDPEKQDQYEKSKIETKKENTELYYNNSKFFYKVRETSEGPRIFKRRLKYT
jgi:hypothetical protein